MDWKLIAHFLVDFIGFAAVIGALWGALVLLWAMSPASL